MIYVREEFDADSLSVLTKFYVSDGSSPNEIVLKLITIEIGDHLDPGTRLDLNKVVVPRNVAGLSTYVRLHFVLKNRISSSRRPRVGQLNQPVIAGEYLDSSIWTSLRDINVCLVYVGVRPPVSPRSALCELCNSRPT